MPAVGKSGLAKIISNHFGIVSLAKDDFKEVLFDTIGFNSREEKLKLGVASMDMMYLVAGMLIKTGQSFILDNNFENSSRPGLEKLMSNSGYRVLTVQLKAPVEIIYNRFIERDKSPDRHRGHVVNTCYPEIGDAAEPVIPLEVFRERYIGRGMNDFSYGDLMVVDATDPSKIDYDRVLNEITAWMESIDE